MTPLEISKLITENIHENNGLILEDIRPELLSFFKKELENAYQDISVHVDAYEIGKEEIGIDAKADNASVKIEGSSFIISFKWVDKQVYVNIIDTTYDYEYITNGYTKMSFKDIVKIVVQRSLEEKEQWKYVNIPATICMLEKRIAILVPEKMHYSKRIKATWHGKSFLAVRLPENVSLEDVAKAYNNNEIPIKLQVRGGSSYIEFGAKDGKVRMLQSSDELSIAWLLYLNIPEENDEIAVENGIDDVVFLTPDMVDDWNNQSM
jgi:hypothetical protein